MVVLSIETVGTQNYIRGFNRYVEDMKDFRPVFRDVAEYFYKTEEKIFSRQGDPEAFQELSPAYKKWKDKRAPGKKIMQLSGRLMESLTGTKQGTQDTFRRIGKTKMELGTRVPYAHRHQEGTFGMPQRKIVQLTEPRKTVISKMIQKWSFETLENDIDFHTRQIQ